MPDLVPPVENFDLAIGHVNHVSFLFCDPGGTRLIIDPFLRGRFEWQGHIERQLNAPSYSADDIGVCTAVLITHIHGDHFEIETVAELCMRAGTRLYGGADVMQAALDYGIPETKIQRIDANQSYSIGDARVVALPNVGSEDVHPCPRFSFGIEMGGLLAFHSGDSHGPSQGWLDTLSRRPDIALLWPSQIDRTIDYLQPRQVVLMHTQQFEPGDFLCNMDHEALRKALSVQFPEVPISYLECGEWIRLVK